VEDIPGHGAYRCLVHAQPLGQLRHRVAQYVLTHAVTIHIGHGQAATQLGAHRREQRAHLGQAITGVGPHPLAQLTQQVGGLLVNRDAGLEQARGQ
jgi:hypothetical protein